MKKNSIFICYSSDDKGFANKLVQDLKDFGVDVWIDSVEIKIGDSLIKKISEGIKTVDYLAVILSPNSVSSEWVNREVEIALTYEIKGRKVKVLPLLYRECEIPAFLADKLYADFTDNRNYRESLLKILERFNIFPSNDSKKTDQKYNNERVKSRLNNANKHCLFLSDDTDFATEIKQLAEYVGFKVKKFSNTAQRKKKGLDGEDFGHYDLIVIVQGEHYNKKSWDKEFYLKLCSYVSSGGFLFATSWVSWMSKDSHIEFSRMLPFAHRYSIVKEDTHITCIPSEDDQAEQIFKTQHRIRASYEELRKKRDSHVLLISSDGTPIFGYRKHGEGIFYYLNLCQHSCHSKMPSPFYDNPSFYDSFRNAFKWIYLNVK